MATSPPPPSTVSSLADLPGDIQRQILLLIPCIADRGSMSLVCRAWRQMIVDNILPPQALLPLLLLPADPFDARGFRAACVLSGGRVHHSLAIDPPNARCFGSYDGAWIFLATLEPRSNVALNIRSGDTRAIPSELLRWTDPQRIVHGMVIHAAALTTSPEEATCVGAAIVTSWPLVPAQGSVSVAALPPRHRCIALWRQNGLWAFDHVVPDEEEEEELGHVEDVIYLGVEEGAFAFLTRGEHLLMCAPILYGNDGLETIWWPVLFRPSGSFYDQHVRARYLVESDGELLMVVRFTPHPDQPTSKFKMFKATPRNAQEADPNFPVADYAGSWTELHTLGGRILFVGHGCSRSYPAASYPGFNGGIYFLDDGEFFDDGVIFGNGNGRCYPCSDNGIWSEGRVYRCFPSSDPSDHSAPVWLLP